MTPEHLREIARGLFEHGKRKKEIARILRLNIKTVRNILDSDPTDKTPRPDKIVVDYALLKSLHQQCDGYAQRIFEILTEEHKIPIGYSTLTRLLREYGIGRPPKPPHQQHPDIPGEEMQHDTSVYTVQLGGRPRKVICSGLYFRFSKMRYVKFFFVFNRFVLKCFFYEALKFFGYCAKICIIDNTSLVIHYGTGERAVFCPEMLQFAKQYGFQWKAHRVRLANRKAGKERNFLTLQTNFFPGRTFRDLEDLNQQVFQWATQRFATRPLSRTRLIPCELFEQEKPHLLKLPDSIQPPYRHHLRIVDGYGYVALHANYYWVPQKPHGKLTLIEYPKTMTVYQSNRKLIEYLLPASDVKNQKFAPPGASGPSRAPLNRRYGCRQEENKLRAIHQVCAAYLDYVQSAASKIRFKPKFIRDLYRLSTQLSRPLFLKTIRRAVKYQISSVDSLERIAAVLIQQELSVPPATPQWEPYEDRAAYQQGRFSSEADLQQYQRLLEDHDDQR